MVRWNVDRCCFIFANNLWKFIISAFLNCWLLLCKTVPCQQNTSSLKLDTTKCVATVEPKEKYLCSGLCWSSPCTTSRPSAVRLILVPGRLAAHTYTPECCKDTSEIIRFPVPRTWIPSTPMERPSDGHRKREMVCELKVKACWLQLNNPPPTI